MDKLDKLIADLHEERRQIDVHIGVLEADRNRLDVRLGILLEAAALRPAPTRQAVTHAAGTVPDGERAAPLKRRGGRQTGSLTNVWKQTIVRWYLADPNGDGLDLATILDIARQSGVKGNDHSIRDRIRKYRDRRHWVEATPHGIRVTRETYERFRPKGVSLTPDHAAPATAEAAPFSELEPA